MLSMAITRKDLVGILHMDPMVIGFGLSITMVPKMVLAPGYSILLNGLGIIIMVIIMPNQQML